MAWYTLASFPVDTTPLISANTPRFNILNNTCTVTKIHRSIESLQVSGLIRSCLQFAKLTLPATCASSNCLMP